MDSWSCVHVCVRVDFPASWAKWCDFCIGMLMFWLTWNLGVSFAINSCSYTRYADAVMNQPCWKLQLFKNGWIFCMKFSIVVQRYSRTDCVNVHVLSPVNAITYDIKLINYSLINTPARHCSLRIKFKQSVCKFEVTVFAVLVMLKFI